ncbi:DUF192 domain-containing protein [Arenibacter certesii]|uniref:DUF192 domain-containing protein n=1 Tax=Arenibacter certesii TaxID=228955 RepID=A0A918IRA9_9FLAO|nr:DUF192 domain-containing protein [Arenibacter certesii]GGW27737.1 hypothetical protein GCM10007383_11500 [Arenibacter certesii]
MKQPKAYIVVLLAILTLVVSCKESEKEKTTIKTAAIEFKKEGTLEIVQQVTDSVLVKLDIEIAETEYETATGLMYRSSMEPKQAMLFLFEDLEMRSFYMKNTEIALDILFIDENNKIVRIQKNAKPFDETGLSSNVPAKSVLEINAGKSDEWGLEVGDSISYQRTP